MKNEPNMPKRRDLAIRGQVARPSSHAMHRSAVPPADLGEGDSISGDFILGILRKWWKVAVPVGAVLAGIAAAMVMYTFVPKYEARAIITIEASPPYIAFAEGSSIQSARYVETQVELLRSPIVLQPVVGRREIANLEEIKGSVDPVEVLGSSLSVRPIGKSELYEVRYVSADPQGAADVVNAVVAEYLNKQKDEDFRRSRQVIALLEEEQTRRSEVVQQRRKEVLELAKDVTGRDPFGQGVTLDMERVFSPLAGIYQQQSSLDVRTKVLEAELQTLRAEAVSNEDPAVSSGMLDLEISMRPEIRQLQEHIELAKTEMQYIKDQLINNKWQTNGRYTQLASTLEQLQKSLTEETERARTQYLQVRAATREESRKQEIAQREAELASLKTQLDLLAKRFEEESGKMQTNDVASVKLEFAKAALAREERVFELIEGRKLALQTELRAPARVSIAQPASTPKRPVEPIPFKLLALAGMGALATPFGLALLREMTVKKISTPDQLIQESKHRLLGEVARFPVRPVATAIRRLNGRAQQEMFIFAESIDAVRTSLMLSESLHRRTDGCIWMIASAVSGEGKTSVATSLVVSFANATKTPTLLIDADMRAPDAAQVLGVANRPGLADVLADKVTVNDAIRRVGETNTYVLPAGRTKGNPHHLVDREKIEKLLETLRPSFPHIIIDTPPVLSASEALIYAKAADFVVYCALRDTTRAKQLRAAVSRLQDAGANVAGTILSGMPVSSYAYAYGVYGEEPSGR